MGGEETVNNGPGDNGTTADKSEVTSSEKSSYDKQKIEASRKVLKFCQTATRDRKLFLLYRKSLREDLEMKNTVRLRLERLEELLKLAREELNRKELELKEFKDRELTRRNIKSAERKKRRAELAKKMKKMRKKRMRAIKKRDAIKEAGTSK